MLGYLAWSEVITLRQVFGTLLIVAAALWVLGGIKDDAPPTPALLPKIKPELSPVIETAPMYNYSQEAAQLNKIMATHGVGFKVREARLSAGSVNYILKRGTDAKTGKKVSIKDLDRKLGDIRADLLKFRKAWGHAVNPGLALDETNCTLTAQRVDPQIMTWADRPQSLEPYHLFLGLADGQPVTMDLNDASMCHALIGGTTGSGKSNLIAGMMLSGAENNTPQQFRIVIIDIGGKRYDAYKTLPHCQRYITEPEDALAYLKSVEKALTGPEGKWTYRTLIVIDEIQKMTRTDDKAEVAAFQRVLKQITGLSRGYGHNLIAATQKPMASILPSEMRDNFPARIAGSCASASQSCMILGPQEDAAAHIRGKGTFIYRVDDNVVINSLFIGAAGSDDEIAAVQEIADKSGPSPIDDRRPSVDDGIMDEFETIDIPPALLEVLQEYDNQNGGLKYGWKTPAGKALAAAMGVPYKGDNYKAIGREMSKYIELYKSGEY